MQEIQHNIENEKYFLDLLGYKLSGPNKSNCFNIYDEDNNRVGFIQYKKLRNAKQKIYGYRTYIDSKNIKCDESRKINDENTNGYDFSFYIKRDDDIYGDYVKISISEFPSLYINSLKYGSVMFFIDYRGLYLNFRSEHDNSFTEETLIYYNSKVEETKDYTYQVRYWDKDKGINYDQNDRTTIEVSINNGNNYNDKRNVYERIWIKGKLVNDNNSETESSIEEFMINHGYGIECFNRFREFINKTLPFNKDITPLLLTDEVINDYNLDILFKKYEKEKDALLKMVI